jgi:hypothetical protein
MSLKPFTTPSVVYLGQAHGDVVAGAPSTQASGSAPAPR